MDLTQLDRQFHASEIEWRIGRCGKGGKDGVWAVALAYVDARAVRARLDDVCGKGGWRIEQPVPVHSDGKLVGFMVGLSVLVDGQWITRWDGADTTETEPFKGGLSSAVRRAAAAFGIGAYLYNLHESFCEVSMEKHDGWNYGKTKDGQVFYWAPPRLPSWALPEGSGSPPPQRRDDDPIPAQERPSGPPAAPQSKQSGMPACPECGKSESVIKGKAEYGGGFVCWKNKGGCGARWKEESPPAEDWPPAEDPFAGQAPPADPKAAVQQLAKATGGKTGSEMEAFDQWAKILLDAPAGAHDAAIKTLLKAVKDGRLNAKFTFTVLKRGLELASTKEQVNAIAEAISPLKEASNMPEELWLQFGELVPQAEDSITS